MTVGNPDPSKIRASSAFEGFKRSLLDMLKATWKWDSTNSQIQFQQDLEATNIELTGAAPSSPAADTLYKGYGRLVLISSASASNDATIDFTSGIDGKYAAYLLVGTTVHPATDSQGILLRISIASSFISADYRWVSSQVFDNATASLIGSTSDSSIKMQDTIGNATGESVAFAAIISNPADTVREKHIFGITGGHDASVAETATYFSGSYRGATSAIDGLRVLFASGNIATGEFSLYGLGNV